MTARVFFLEDGEVKSGILRDLDRFIETTTRPTGIGPKYYATTVSKTVEAVTDDDGNELEPEHQEFVWVLAKWATWGGPEIVVHYFDNEADALKAAEERWIDDILNNNEMAVYSSREEAMQALANL